MGDGPLLAPDPRGAGTRRSSADQVSVFQRQAKVGRRELPPTWPGNDATDLPAKPALVLVLTDPNGGLVRRRGARQRQSHSRPLTSFKAHGARWSTSKRVEESRKRMSRRTIERRLQGIVTGLAYYRFGSVARVARRDRDDRSRSVTGPTSRSIARRDPARTGLFSSEKTSIQCPSLPDLGSHRSMFPR